MHLLAELSRFDALCRQYGGDDIDLDDPDQVDALMEGETNLKELAEALIADREDLDVLVVGLQAKIKEFQARLSTYKARQERIKEALATIVDRTPDKRLALTSATAYFAKGRGKVVIDNPDLVPEEFRKEVEPAFNLTEIGRRLANREYVAGAKLQKGEPSLVIRTT